MKQKLQPGDVIPGTLKQRRAYYNEHCDQWAKDIGIDTDHPIGTIDLNEEMRKCAERGDFD
jgi:hypothetical protein